jgi:transposase
MDTSTSPIFGAEVFHGQVTEGPTDVRRRVQARSRPTPGGAARGVSLAQVGRELGVRPDLLRVSAKQVHARAGATPQDVFPGQGRLPSEQEELRRLQRENARLQQELEFLKKAAAYFAKESR